LPAAIALSVLVSCLTPPALFSPGPVDLEACVRKAPSGTERVELASGKRMLRGVFVPAGDNAPVVLHLMSSGQSIASSIGPTHRLFRRGACAQQGAGCASPVKIAWLGAGTWFEPASYLDCVSSVAWGASTGGSPPAAGAGLGSEHQLRSSFHPPFRRRRGA
jgi:hypothetical protein